jgi:hypothetical protein
MFSRPSRTEEPVRGAIDEASLIGTVLSHSDVGRPDLYLIRV